MNARRVVGVADLTREIAQTVADGLSGLRWVRGEIASFSESRGNLYFDLVESDACGSRVTVKVRVLSWQRAAFDRDVAEMPGFELADGLQVVVGGTVGFYEPWGELRLQVTRIDATHTLGEIHVARQRLLARLRDQGILQTNAQHSVGVPPVHVGLVTSSGSKAEQDVLATLAACRWRVHVRLAPTSVQGPACESQIVEAFGRLGDVHRVEPLDVVILARGGGSQLDLSGFDTAGVAQAIIDAPFPVWTAIGHETDHSVADEVAHTHWRTPTAAAQAVVSRIEHEGQRAASASADLRTLAVAMLGQEQARLDDLAVGLHDATLAHLRLAQQRLDHVTASLKLHAHAGLTEGHDRVGQAAADLGDRPWDLQLHDSGDKLQRLENSLVGLPEQLLGRQQDRLQVASSRLEALDPRVQLARGYSITTLDDGRLLRRLAEVQEGSIVHTRLIDGTVHAAVIATNPHTPDPTRATIEGHAHG